MCRCVEWCVQKGCRVRHEGMKFGVGCGYEGGVRYSVRCGVE